MHVIQVSSGELHLAEVPDPVAGEGQVLIGVAAAGVNRADIQQRQGKYPPPAGAPDWLGLEVSGQILAVGPGVEGWTVGDRVCALLAGGGYASLAVSPADQLLPVPAGVGLQDAAGLPEAVATVWSNLVMTARLRAGETVLIHGGGSGIGTIAIQLARSLGALVAVTAGSAGKLDACARLGAEILINYTEEDFVERVTDATEGRGAEVILDAIGGAYLDRDLQALAVEGRIVFIGNQSGESTPLDIRRLMGKRGSIHGTTLRSRPPQQKAQIIASVRENVWPLVESGQIRPIIAERFALTDAAAAHALMESSAHFGKILLLP